MKKEQIRIGVSYTRVSTLGQLHRGDGSRIEDSSPEAQKLRCEDYLKHLAHRHGIAHQIKEHICDEGFSGKNTNRPGFKKLWSLIENEKIDFVVATELSRISRSVVDFLEFISHCERHKVAVSIIGLDFDTSSPTGKVMLTMLVGLAQFEREMTSQRVRENAYARLVKDGKINGASEILGLKRDPERRGHFLPDEFEIQILKTVLQTYLKCPSRKATLIELKKLPEINSLPKKFTMRTLEIILQNAQWRYRGRWHINRQNKDVESTHLPESKQYKIVDLPHGQIVDLKLLDKVQEKIERQSVERKRSGKNGYIYLLSRIIKTEDGLHLSGYSAKSGQYRYYRHNESKIRIDADQIHKVILNRMKLYFRNSDHLKRLLNEAAKKQTEFAKGFNSEINQSKKEIQKLEQSLRQLTSHLIESDKLADKDFLNFIKDKESALKAQIATLRSSVAELEAQKAEATRESGVQDLTKLLADFTKGFDKLTGSQKRDFIERTFREIVVHPDNRLELKLFEKPPSLRVTGRKKSMYSEVSGGPSVGNPKDFPPTSTSPILLRFA